MNSVLNRASTTTITTDQFATKPCATIKKLPTSYYYSNGTNSTTALGAQGSSAKIKWRNQSSQSYQRHSIQPIVPISNGKNNSVKFKLMNSSASKPQTKHLSRSISTDVTSMNLFSENNKTDKLNNSSIAIDPVDSVTVKNAVRSSRIGKIESTESIIEMHKFFKEKRIYSDANDNYKRRTIVLVKSPGSNGHGNSRRSISTSGMGVGAAGGDFGFHLQSYGLVNTSTQLTEFICFVDNVQVGSPAKHAGLNNGDVLLAIDCIAINEFKNLHDIMKHVRGKNELRLVIMCENVCKKIQLQQRVDAIQSSLADKKLELERMNKQHDLLIQNLLNKNNINSSLPTSLTSFSPSPSISMTSSSSISESHSYNNPSSPNFSNAHNNTTAMLSPTNNVQESSSNLLIKNSTPNDFKSNSILSPVIINFNSTDREQVHQEMVTYEIEEQPEEIVDEIMDRQKSSSSPNGTARIQVDLDFTSPIIQTSSSTYSTCSTSSTASSSTSSSTGSTDPPNHPTGITFHRTRQLAQKCLQETTRIVRSASSSSMNLLSNFKMNRSSRSRNSSICSTTLNDSAIDLNNDPKKMARFNKKLLSKSIISDASVANKIITDLTNEQTSHAPKPIKQKKNNTPTDNITSFSTVLSQQPANKKQQIPQLMHNPSFVSHKTTLFKKLNPDNNSTLFENSSASKFTILQNKPKNDRYTKVPTASTSPPQSSSNTSFFSQPFSPIFSPNQSSLLSEIIDSGIDVGVGLVGNNSSPNNSNNSSSNWSSEAGVAKIVSDGGYKHHSYMIGGALKATETMQTNSFRNGATTRQVVQSSGSESENNQNCLITKL